MKKKQKKKRVILICNIHRKKYRSLNEICAFVSLTLAAVGVAAATAATVFRICFCRFRLYTHHTYYCDEAKTWILLDWNQVERYVQSSFYLSYEKLVVFENSAQAQLFCVLLPFLFCAFFALRIMVVFVFALIVLSFYFVCACIALVHFEVNRKKERMATVPTRFRIKFCQDNRHAFVIYWSESSKYTWVYVS